MKTPIIICFLLLSFFSIAQIPVTAVNIVSVPTIVSTTYTGGDSTYNWSMSPNNSTVLLTGFTAGGLDYGFTSAFSGTVKLRRVDNLNASGNFTLIWAEYLLVGLNVFNMFPEYQNDMEPFFNNHTYNKGTDNFFDNTSANSNNVERLDWILPTGYATPAPGKIGFAVFDRGAVAGHDPFCIAAITALDGLGNPAAYGTLVRVVTANYGDPAASSVTYKIVKGPSGTDLLDAGGNTQNRGGVFISLQGLGIAANTLIYGYSLFATDMPVGATSANMVDYTDPVYFPLNTSTALGGIDLIAVTGIYTDLTILPTRFMSFDAVEKNNDITLKWKVENEANVDRYVIERSSDGIRYFTINEVTATGNNAYSINDNVVSQSSAQLFYRIKQYDHNGSFYFSKILVINRNNRSSAIIIYPNPVDDNLFINIAATSNEKATITVNNSMGSQVIIQQVQFTNGNNYFNLNGVDKLSTGIYQLSITWESGKIVTKQFVKQ